MVSNINNHLWIHLYWHFLEFLAGIIDFFFRSSSNFIKHVDFNAQLPDSVMKDFIKVNGLIKLIKENTCLKGHGSSIDLILTKEV